MKKLVKLWDELRAERPPHADIVQFKKGGIILKIIPQAGKTECTFAFEREKHYLVEFWTKR